MLVNGLGLGNATRGLAVAERLAAAGHRVVVGTSGNGGWYLEGRSAIAELRPLVPLAYGASGGRLSVAATVRGAGAMLGAAWENERRVASWVREARPDVAVIDSVYHVAALRRAGVRIVAINNADGVVAGWRRYPDRPRSASAQFHVVEANDVRFHRCFADLVLSPCLDPSLPELGAPYVRVPPIVGAGVQPSPRAGPARRVLIMLSGSVFGSPVRLRAAPPGVEVDVVGREGDGAEVPGVRFHGRVRDAAPFVQAADLVVLNGGFSAVSEAFVARRPMIVVPVPNHAEQWVNARTVAALGVGAIGGEDDLDGQIARGLAQLDAWRAAYATLPDPGWGAEEAARRIVG
jgi:UDP:flavonoid glycosyltransferase YjiC (YdhE family)